MKNIFRQLFILIVLILMSFTQLKAQQPITISVNVVPPYSNFISDYYNKTIVTLISNSVAAGSVNVKLKGRITGNNNISISSTNFVYNTSPLTLTSFVPKTLTAMDISRIFDINNLTLSGISRADLISKGLPAGEYNLCVYVYDYTSGKMLTLDDPNTCSVGFNISSFSQTLNVEPPMLITPYDGEEQPATTPQTVIFSWTPPATTAANIQYTLRIVDVLPFRRSPQDAMASAAYPYFFEQTVYSNVFAYGPAQPALIPGHKYAFSVTAKEPQNRITFINNGTSEVRSFIFKNQTIPTNDNLSLNFIKPSSNNNIIKVNNDNDFLLSWNWFDSNYAQDTLHINDTAYRQYGVKKYVLSIANSSKKSILKGKPISYTKIFTESNNKLTSYVNLPKTAADSIGFTDSCWYKATVKAYDASSQEVTTATSVDFQYIKMHDDIPAIKIPVSAVMKYIFKDKNAALNNIPNTPCKIYALKKADKLNSLAPKITFNGIDYVSISDISANTDDNGALHTTISIPSNLLGHDSIYFRLTMPDKNYIDRDFPLIAMRGISKDTSVNFGQLVALTYGYSLKLYVKKAYTSYLIKEKNGQMSISMNDSIFRSNKSGYQYVASSEGMSYAVESKKIAEGITIVLYRKNKTNYIPPIEGTITDYKHITGYTEVARGVTQKETDTTTFVTFDKLLSAISPSDEYYIQALSINNSTTKTKTVQKGVVNSSVTNTSFPYLNLAYNDDGFFGQEVILNIPLPKTIVNDDSLYRHITATYEIVSTKPPTSLVKGRLMYHWKSDQADQLRPLANATFRIVTDYLVNGRPIGEISTWKNAGGTHSFNEIFFVPDGKSNYSDGMSLLDHNQTMAIGHTDAQGNFTVDVVNLNTKGSLGNGHLVDKGTSWTDPADKPKPGSNFGNVVNPDPGYDNIGYTGIQGIQNNTNANSSVQNQINGSAVSFSSATNSFNVGNGAAINGAMSKGVQTRGMVPPLEVINDNDPDLVAFQRVYRIVPENKYLYPSKETFVVQPFKALNITDPLKSYVKEVQVNVQTKDGSNNLNQMLVTVFRSLEDKTDPDLPIGEGNGKYKYTELTSPQYKTTGESFDNKQAKSLKTDGNVFSKKYEILWPAAQNNSAGVTSFTTLLAGYEDYYVEACSDPLGGKTYQATFSSIDTYIDDLSKPEYLLGEAYPPAITVNMKLIPLPSRALIRVLDNASKNSISGSKGGRISINGGYETFVDKDGYAEFLANTYPLNIFANQSGTSQVTFDAKAYGYKKAAVQHTNHNIPQITIDPKFTFNPTGSQFFYNFLLDPSALLQGHIVNLDSKTKTGVPAYIKVDSGKVVETDNNGVFSNMPLPGLAGTKVSIIPKDVGFFDTAYVVTNADLSKQTIDIKDYGVYRRKHRIKFIINDKSSTLIIPIANATIQLGDTSITTNNVGVASMVFENVSVNNFTFIIRGPNGKNYIPKTLNVQNQESKDFATVNVTLETGSVVQGKVTLDGKPVKNAKVYLDVTQQQAVSNMFINAKSAAAVLSNDASLVIAYTDANGNYSLKGVPVNNQKVYVHATLDTTFTVNGDIQPANIKNKSAITNLSLTSFKAMLVNNIYGFPLTVEKITPTKSDSSEVKVTGIVHWSDAISDFSLEESNQTLRIEDVAYKMAIVNGKKVGLAQTASVVVNGISSLKFKYLNKYNVKLTSVKSADAPLLSTIEPLVISKDNDLGVIKGRVNIVDNSFNFPSTYLNFNSAKNNFYLAEKSGRAGVNTFISAVTSAMTETEVDKNYYTTNALYSNDILTKKSKYLSLPTKLYNLSNEKGDAITFKLIEFNASANPLKSFISSDGKIHLNTSLSCHIANAQPENFNLTIDDMVLDENKVYPANSDSPIKLALENWTLTIKDWSFSTEKGGIVSDNGMINTKAIDIPFTTFVLRHDLFLMDNFQMKSLKMAGGAITLQNVSDKAAGLVYDSKTGTDMKPHWRFSISGSPAAELPDLTGLSGKIKLNYIQILSNNESVFQLQQQGSPLKINNNPIANYSPESIYNGPDYISISGALNVGAPRMGDVQLLIDYNNPKTMKLESVQTDFEGQGFVHFVARNPGNNIPNITIDATQVKILGNLIEKPTKTFNELSSTFYASITSSQAHKTSSTVYKIDIDKDFVTQLTSEGNATSSKGHSMKISTGGMTVANNDWSILTYEGYMSSNTAEKNTQPAYMKFAVMGDISVSSDALTVSDINTPFGNIKMVFDFANKRLIGKLEANKVSLGTSTVTGTIETLFDPEGFFIAGGCKADVKLPNPYIDGTYNMGFMIGSYTITDELWTLVNSYKNPAVIDNCYRTSTAKGKLNGFYFTLDRTIIEANIDFDFILASGYIKAVGLIGADVYANFTPGNFAVGLSGYAYANVSAGLSCITGTSISGSLTAKALVEFKYANSTFSTDADLNLGFKASISQSLVLTTISKDISVNCHAAAGTQGFSFSLGDGKDIKPCE